MNLHLGNKTQNGKSYYFEVEVGPKPETFESYMKRVFAGVGLKSDYSIKAFDNFIGESFFRRLLNEAKSNSGLVGALQNPQGKVTKVLVHVYPEVVEKLRQFGINLLINQQGKATFTGHTSSFNSNVKKYQNFTPAPEKPVSQWTTIEKLDSVIRRAALLLPEEVGNQLLSFLSPVALAAMAAVLIIWIGGHFFVASEIADVILLIVGGLFLGLAAFQAGGLLANFAIKCVDGRTEKDLDESAQFLAEAIALIGIQTVMALLLAKAPKVFRESRNSMGNSVAKPYSMKTIGEPPVTEGSLFYKPKTTIIDNPNPFGKSGGVTNQWGDVSLVISKVASEAEVAKIHELVHRFLTPKLQLFPKLRQATAVLKSNGYLKSYILRYLEEAFAETIAQLIVNGVNWRNFLIGVKFPLGTSGGTIYVSQAAMRTEAIGVLLGPINVNGMIFNVYYSVQENK